MLLALQLNNLLAEEGIAPVEDTTVIVPYLIGDTQAAAQMRIASIFCVDSVTGTTGTVTAQSPQHMSIVSRGSTISVTLGGAMNNPSRNPPGQSTYNQSIH